MKITLQFFAITFCAILLSGCSKNGDAPVSEEQKVVNNLTGIGNRVWRLSKVFVNGVEQALTSDQKRYTKTYTLNPTMTLAGTFTNSDNNFGQWFTNGPRALIEIIVTIGGIQVQIDYLIREITETTLDIQYTKNGQTIREVYYAF